MTRELSNRQALNEPMEENSAILPRLDDKGFQRVECFITFSNILMKTSRSTKTNIQEIELIILPSICLFHAIVATDESKYEHELAVRLAVPCGLLYEDPSNQVSA